MNSISITEVFDPRGRADRKGLGILALILLAAQLAFIALIKADGLEPNSPAAWVINTVLLWVGVTGISKRLHDLGLSAAWLLWALLATFVWSFAVSFILILAGGDAAGTPDHTNFMLAFGISFAPLIGATLWLHAAKGDPSDNRFGPVTGPSGFSRFEAGDEAGSTA